MILNYFKNISKRWFFLGPVLLIDGWCMTWTLEWISVTIAIGFLGLELLQCEDDGYRW